MSVGSVAEIGYMLENCHAGQGIEEDSMKQTGAVTMRDNGVQIPRSCGRDRHGRCTV